MRQGPDEATSRIAFKAVWSEATGIRNPEDAYRTMLMQGISSMQQTFVIPNFVNEAAPSSAAESR
jgi:hypothetical protein